MTLTTIDYLQLVGLMLAPIVIGGLSALLVLWADSHLNDQ